MGSSSFGLGSDFEKFLEKVFKVINNPPTWIYGQQTLSELYETHFGIFDHTTSQNPLSTVLFHPKEDTVKGGRYRATFERFCTNDIYTRTGLSWDKFIKLTPGQIDMIVREVSKKNKGDSDALKNVKLGLVN